MLYLVPYKWYEIHVNRIVVDAESKEDAIEKVKHAFEEDDIDLVGNNFTFSSIEDYDVVTEAVLEATDNDIKSYKMLTTE
jgi:hypothetical protein